MLRSEVRPTGDIVLGRGERLEAQHRSAPSQNAQAERGIEAARTLGRWIEALADEALESCEVEIRPDHAMAVVVDETETFHVVREHSDRLLSNPLRPPPEHS